MESLEVGDDVMLTVNAVLKRGKIFFFLMISEFSGVLSCS